MEKIRKGDEVIVLTGRNRGVRGAVIARLSDDKVLVQGVNLVKRHVKPVPMKNVAGGIVSQESPVHISNVALVDPVTGRAGKVRIQTLADGKKVRVFKSSGEAV